MERFWRLMVCIFVLVCVALGGVACSDDNETPPPTYLDGKVGGDGSQPDAGTPDTNAAGG